MSAQSGRFAQCPDPKGRTRRTPTGQGNLVTLSENANPGEPRRGVSARRVRQGGSDEARGVEAAEAAGRIGPNAITQLEAVLLERLGRVETARLFASAGAALYLGQPPTSMVDERDVARVHHQVRVALPIPKAHEILREAGDRTGRYILANRIPRPVVFALRHLPASLSARLLRQAIAKHAWTFAGSGAFDIHRAPGPIIVARIARNPVVALDRSVDPICAWHAAVFQRLFRELVDTTATVKETDCCADGAPACRFEIRIDGGQR